MRDYTTPAYIEPIAAEILTRWKYRDLSEYYPGALYLEERKPQHRHTATINLNTFTAGTLYAMKTETAAAVFTDLDDWTKAAETYPGELDPWNDRERGRIAEAVKNTLINLYREEARTA